MWKEILHFFQFFRLAVCLPKEITRIFILTQNHATTRSLRGTLSAKGTKLEVKQVQRGGPLGALVLVHWSESVHLLDSFCDTQTHRHILGL